MVQEIRFSLLCLMDCIYVRVRDKESLHWVQKLTKTKFKTQNPGLQTSIIQRIPKIAVLLDIKNKSATIERDKEHIPEERDAKRWELEKHDKYVFNEEHGSVGRRVQ